MGDFGLGMGPGRLLVVPPMALERLVAVGE